MNKKQQQLAVEAMVNAMYAKGIEDIGVFVYCLEKQYVGESDAAFRARYKGYGYTMYGPNAIDNAIQDWGTRVGVGERAILAVAAERDAVACEPLQMVLFGNQHQRSALA